MLKDDDRSSNLVGSRMVIGLDATLRLVDSSQLLLLPMDDAPTLARLKARDGAVEVADDRASGQVTESGKEPENSREVP